MIFNRLAARSFIKHFGTHGTKAREEARKEEDGFISFSLVAGRGEETGEARDK